MNEQQDTNTSAFERWREGLYWDDSDTAPVQEAVVKPKRQKASGSKKPSAKKAK